MFTTAEQQYILNLARSSIEHYFSSGKMLAVNERELPSEQLKQAFSCFVTLTIGGNLRGCIGHVEPIQPLHLDIIENAVSAAFSDPRFFPLTEEEYRKVEIEVSVLTKPRKLFFSGSQDLLNKLRPNTDGVIIRRGRYGATYLPQVWEDLPDKKEFLSSLCQKAGLSPDDWQERGMDVMVYQVEKIK